MHRGPPTRPHLASTALRRVQVGCPLSKSLLSQGKVVPIRGLRKPCEVPATGVRPSHDNQVHTLARAKAQALRGPENTIVVLSLNNSHYCNRITGSDR